MAKTCPLRVIAAGFPKIKNINYKECWGADCAWYVEETGECAVIVLAKAAGSKLPERS